MGNAADHLPISSAEVKNEKLFIPVLQNRGPVDWQPVHYSTLHGRRVIRGSKLLTFSTRGV